MTLNRVNIPSPNYSSRGGATVRLAVVHTAEGALSYTSLGSFFSSSSSGVSSQVGIDDTPGTVGEYVSRANKSWCQASYNPVATAAELCGFAAWSRAEWENNHATMLDNCRQWLAEECAHFAIPLVKLTPAQAQGNGRGVCAHSDLGVGGGNHSDPGPGFPWDRVLGGAAPAPEPEPEEEEDMLVLFGIKGGTYVSNGIEYRWVANQQDLNAINHAWPTVRNLGPVNGFNGFGVPADPTTASLSGEPWPVKGPAPT